MLNNKEYTIVENYKDAIRLEELEALFTEYFFDYDYVLGDYSYNKLRLKGYYGESSKKKRKLNDIKSYKEYLKEYCAFECPYFLIKKENIVEKKS